MNRKCRYATSRSMTKKTKAMHKKTCRSNATPARIIFIQGLSLIVVTYSSFYLICKIIYIVKALYLMLCLILFRVES